MDALKKSNEEDSCFDEATAPSGSFDRWCRYSIEDYLSSPGDWVANAKIVVRFFESNPYVANLIIEFIPKTARLSIFTPKSFEHFAMVTPNASVLQRHG